MTTAGMSRALKQTNTPALISGSWEICISIRKNAGSITITAEASEDHNWALQPIVMKAYNSLGHSDYTAGFVPDTEVIEPLDLVPFGDLEDPLLKQALFMVSGTARIARQEQKDIPGIIDTSVAHKPVTMKRITNPGIEGSN